MEKKETLLEYANRLKEERLERERVKEEKRKELIEKIDNTPYLYETVFLSKFMCKLVESRRIIGLELMSTFDLNEIRKDGETHLENFYPKLRLRYKKRDKLILLGHLYKVSFNYKEERLYIEVLIINRFNKIQFRENFDLDTNDVINLYNDYKEEYAKKWKPLALESVFYEFYNNKKSDTIKKLKEISDALIEIFMEQEKDKIIIGGL